MFEISLSLCDSLLSNFKLDNYHEVLVTYYKGHALYNLGRFEEALATFDLTLESNSKFEFAYSTKSELLFELEKYDDALDFINQGLSLFPNGKLNFNKSRFLFHSGEYDDALIYINKFLDYDSEYSEAIELKKKIESKLAN